MREILFWFFSSLAVLAFLHSTVLWAVTRWHGRNVDLVYADYDEFKRRKANPPWYVRYSMWFSYTVMRQRNQLPPARAPRDVSVVDVNGQRVQATRVVYLGPDVLTGLHAYEAWFPAGVEVNEPPDANVGEMPGRTSLAFRFES